MRRSEARDAVFLLLLTTACTPAPVPETKMAPKVSFSFTAPEKCSIPGSAKVTFAVVQPQWQSALPGMAGNGTGGASSPLLQSAALVDYMRPGQLLYEELASSMKNDFFSLLTCKGFATKGPFRTYDEMVYPDRAGSDLVLVPELDLRLVTETESSALGFSESMSWRLSHKDNEPRPVHLKGSSTISGRITLALKESITNTRMWTKSVEVAPESFTFAGEKVYLAGYSSVYSQIVVGDPGFQREFGPKLVAIYQTAMNTAWKFMDVRDMEMVKRQALEPRGKASIRVP